eukprot:359702-Chlamydomonas_euryale.AAC.11
MLPHVRLRCTLCLAWARRWRAQLPSHWSPPLRLVETPGRWRWRPGQRTRAPSTHRRQQRCHWQQRPWRRRFGEVESHAHRRSWHGTCRWHGSRRPLFHAAWHLCTPALYAQTSRRACAAAAAAAVGAGAGAAGDGGDYDDAHALLPAGVYQQPLSQSRPWPPAPVAAPANTSRAPGRPSGR